MILKALIVAGLLMLWWVSVHYFGQPVSLVPACAGSSWLAIKIATSNL